MPVSKQSLLDKWRLLQAIIARRDLKPSRKVIAAKLLDHLNTKTGRCFPSYNTLGAGVGLGKRTAIKCVGDLESAGVLRRHRKSRAAVRPGAPASDDIDFNWSMIDTTKPANTTKPSKPADSAKPAVRTSRQSRFLSIQEFCARIPRKEGQAAQDAVLDALIGEIQCQHPNDADASDLGRVVMTALGDYEFRKLVQREEKEELRAHEI